MSEARNFNRSYIENELHKLDTKLSKKTTLHVAGGAAMAFYGLKEATKDIDVIVRSETQRDSLVQALHDMSYSEPGRVTAIYAQMEATATLENQDGFRWDVFNRIVAHKLSLSRNMITRSQRVLTSGRLEVRLLSKEDIFLLKSVTDRERDLEDMGIVAESGIDWKIVAAECSSQAAESTMIWEDALCDRLTQLREKRGIVSPIEKNICRIADKKIAEKWIIEKVEAGAETVNNLAKESGEPERIIRNVIRELVRKKVLAVDRSTRPHRFTLRKTKSKMVNSFHNKGSNQKTAT
ncbi:MAG: DUF6036 family nucleotidyltransferase [archaeon]